MISNAMNFVRRHSHTHWALLDQALVSGTNFLTGILVAHGLGVADFGRFSLAWLVVLFVQSFQECGVIAPMMSIGPKYEAPRQPAYYGGVFAQQLILAVVSSLLTWACLRFAASVFLKRPDASLALPLTVAVLLCQSQEFLRRYFFTVLKPATSFASDVFATAANFADWHGSFSFHRLELASPRRSGRSPPLRAWARWWCWRPRPHWSGRSRPCGKPH